MSLHHHGSRIQLVLLAAASVAGAALLTACDARSASAAPAQSAPAKQPSPLVIEPTTLNMGDLVPDVSVTKRVKLTNRSDKPLKITNAVADCSCTTPTWPNDPIPPGATVETDISIKPGPKQGVSLTKRVTFSIDGADPVFLTVIGKVGLFIEQSTDMIRAPADDFVAPPPEKITLRGADNTPFKVLGVEPACLTADDSATGMNHSLTVNWEKWRELKKPLKFTILTDHPKTPELVVMVRRTVSSKPSSPPPPAPPAPTAPKSEP